MESDQLVMWPMSLAPSWTMYNDHVPFGVPPSKVERATSPLGVGAGGGKKSSGLS
jgi:hypothetical protein